MLTIHRTLNSIGKLVAKGGQVRSFSQLSLSQLSSTDICLSHTNDRYYYINNTTPMLGTSNITFHPKIPFNYKNYYFWLESLEDNYYAYGIKRRFISEFGNVKYINIEEDPIQIMSAGDYIGNIENEKTLYTIESPFNNCIVIDAKEDICLDTLNNDPENTANYLCVLEHVSV
jgi:glycine cleavage system H lipoate-binding protein